MNILLTSDSDSNSERRDHSHVITIDNVTLSEEEVMVVKMNLDSNKAQCPDNIPARLLKETAMQITPSFCALFNKSLSVGVLPGTPERGAQGGASPPFPFNKGGRGGESALIDKNSNPKNMRYND